MRWNKKGSAESKLTLFLYGMMREVGMAKVERALDFAEVAMADRAKFVELSNGWAAGAEAELAARLTGNGTEAPAQKPEQAAEPKPEKSVDYTWRRGRHPHNCIFANCLTKRGEVPIPEEDGEAA